jgi:NAD(P)-dependent dehydrogenase (short-subunit alcohol dehydrogenase family)
MIKEFKDKVAVVTGAASGIGRSLAFAFAKLEMKVVISDVNEQALNSVSEELIAGGTDVMSMVVDVSDRAQVAKLADATYERFGSANILCNNAGVGSGGMMQFLELADWDWVLGVNLFGVVYGIKSFLPRMLASGEPCHIVNTASLAGHLSGDTVPYSPSKFAVVAISEALKRECFSTKVGVSVLCPGLVDTQIVKNAESFRSERPDLFQPTTEMIEMSKTMRENFSYLLSTGMNPDVIAQKVIIAIKEDILQVITHPEYIPVLEARFESIRDDTMKLDQIYKDSVSGDREAPMTSLSLKKFEHDSPRFSIQYPEEWVQLKAPPLLTHAVFYALRIPGADFTIRVIDKSDPALPSDYSLENATSYRALFLENFGTGSTIISDKQTTLKDGTPANEGLIEYKNLGIVKIKVIDFTVDKGDKWIVITIGVNSKCFEEEFKEIPYALEFDL